DPVQTRQHDALTTVEIFVLHAQAPHRVVTDALDDGDRRPRRSSGSQQLVAPDENVGPAEDLDRIRSGDVLQIVDEAAADRHAVALDAHALVHAADLHAIEIEAFTDDPHAAGATSVDHGVLDPQSHGPAGVDSV